MKYLFLILFTTFFFNIVSFAQRRQPPTSSNLDDLPLTRNCYTMQMDSILRTNNKRGSLLEFESRMKKAVDSYRTQKQSMRTETDTMIIPVIVHVVHNGDAIGVGPNITTAQIYSQFDALNEDYNKKYGTNGYNTNPVGAAMLIKFVPATNDLNGNKLAEPGIHRYNGKQDGWTSNQIEKNLKPVTQWNPTKYFNIWTAKFSGSLATTLGYTQFPSLSGLDGLDADEGTAITDGVVIRFNAFGTVGNVKAPYNLGRTATHEIGHFLGLRHIWGDESNCTGTDYCNDTPATPDSFYGCPSSGASCKSGVQAMYQNYLDYTNDACMNIFTNDQKDRVMAVLQTSPRRKELLTSDVYQPSKIPKANFNSNQKSVCAGSSITLNDVSTNLAVSSNWTVYNSDNFIVATSTSKNFTFTPNTIGNYSVKLIAANQYGKNTLYIQNYLTVLSNTVNSLPFVETLETTTILSNWIYYNPSGNGTWQVNTSVSGFGNGQQSLFFNNYDTSYNKTGIVNGIISPKYNFQSNLHAYLVFDMAYARYKTYSDTLGIYYSVDCGLTYNLLWKIGGSNLATAPDTEDFFVPTPNQWRKVQVSLSALNGLANVNFKIVNISGWSNALYLDNINIWVPNRVSVPGSNFVASLLTVCNGEQVVLSDQSTQYPTAWAWTITEKDNKAAPISSNRQYPEIKFNVPGTYQVSLTASNTLGIGTTTNKLAYINVNSGPTISLIASATQASCGQVVNFSAYGGIKYAWYNDKSDEPITTSTGYSIYDTMRYTTTYTVYGYNAKGCTGYDDVRVSVNGNCSLTGISSSNFDPKKMISVFPNPVRGQLNIAISEDFKTISDPNFILYNLHADKILEQKLSLGLNSISLENIIAGMYFYSIGNVRGKIVIE